MVALPSNFYIVYTVLFHTDVVADVAVTNCMSHFSFFFLTKATIKIDNGNTVHSQDIRKFLYSFPNCSIICTGGPVYYFPGHPSNTISSVSLKFYVGFQKVVSDPLEYCDFVGPQGCSLISPIRLKTINSLFKYKFAKINPQRNMNTVVPTVDSLSKNNIDPLIHQRFERVSIFRLKKWQ